MSADNRSLEQLTTAPRPAAIASQATAVEQARAVAEIHAKIVVAQQCPRNVPAAVEAMRESTAQIALADRAFFAYPKGTTTVTGASIHLARELARVWGNIEYGISELRRDDDAKVSEMLAFAWDIQTNTTSRASFIVPHSIDTKKGRKDLVDLRDVYENNANQGARRVREAIFSVLPAWFTEEAKTRCTNTVKGGGGNKSLAQLVDDAVKAYSAIGVAVDQLETNVGRGRGHWTEHDVAQLRIRYQSIDRGELRKEDEFPQKRVTAAEISGQATAPATTAPATTTTPPAEPDPVTGELPIEDPPADQSWPESPVIKP